MAKTQLHPALKAAEEIEKLTKAEHSALFLISNLREIYIDPSNPYLCELVKQPLETAKQIEEHIRSIKAVVQQVNVQYLKGLDDSRKA